MSLPSTRSLEAFVAVARLGSLGSAGPRLGMSVPALSRRLAVLERELGVRLLDRLPRGVALTAAGSRFLPKAAAILEQLASATADLRQADTAVRVTTIPALATRWLLPRLPDFYAQHPGIRVDVRTSLGFERVDAGGFDLAIRLALDHEIARPPLLPIHLAPVWSEEFADLVAGPDDLLVRPLVGPEHRPEFWSEWLRSAGLHAAASGIRQVDPLLLYELTAREPVVAMGIEPLVSPLLTKGRLRRLEAGRIRSQRSFFLVGEAEARTSAVRAFAAWLRREAGSEHPPLAPPTR